MLQFSICSVLMDHYFDEAKNGANFITPEKIAKNPKSYTGIYLKKMGI